MGFKNELTKKNYLHKYYEEHKNEIKKRHHEYFSTHREKFKENLRKWELKNPEKVKERSKRYREKNKEKIRIMRKEKYFIYAKKQKEYKNNMILKVLIHYSGNQPHCQCPECNENNIKFLTIDHINGGGNKHRKQLGGSGFAIYKWLIHNNYPEGYQVLCYNCNCGKNRNNGVCPHKC